jgi:gas vesicle protein
MTHDMATDHAATDRVATDQAAMNTSPLNGPHLGFAAGFITGGIIGAVWALASAPRAGADLRRSVASSARDLGTAASGRYRDAAARVSHAVDHLPGRVRAEPDDVADAVASDAHDVTRLATATKS